MNSLMDAVKRWHTCSISSAKILICKALAHFHQQAFENFYFAHNFKLTVEEIFFLENVLSRLKREEPLSKILGVSSFYGRNFIINEHVLDPRPDSECLIDTVLTYHKNHNFQSMLDLGIGSGCLSITLLLEIPKLTAVGVDSSIEALNVVQQNMQKFNVKNRLQIFQSDWFYKVPKHLFDCIISNPPYIESDYPLDGSVLNYDPHAALFSGSDGLKDYRLIFKDLSKFLKQDGFFFGEIGFNQKKEIQNLINSNPSLLYIDCLKDLDARDRVVVVKKRSPVKGL
jgi:release factor glutamine methyltransferase